MSSPSPFPEEDSDARLARVDEILEEVTARARKGEPVAAEDIYARHPDLAAELRAVMPGALGLELASLL